MTDSDSTASDKCERHRRDCEALQSALLANIKASLPRLEKLQEENASHWGYEDPIYRFYHQSFKVYWLQSQTREMADLLRSLAPGEPVLHPFFEKILSEGAGGTEFEMDHNREWLEHTRPFVEAFFHARYFLEMAIKYSKELKEPPTMLPSGWAAVLCLYNLR